MNLPSSVPSDLAAPLIQAAARLGPFAGRIAWYPEVSSTNDVAAAMAEHGAEEGRVVAANAQTAGRGRHGRTWASPPDAGLYVSTVLRPPPEALPVLTLAAGVAVVEGIALATGLAVDLKWPNDVHAAGRKVAGILAEAADTYVVLGFGINIRPARYPADIAARATSLEGELGRAVDRGLLLAECLAALASRYLDAQRRPSAVIEAWRARAAATFGRRVRCEAGGGIVEGVAEDIDSCGALMVRTATGTAHVVAGEVTWV